MKIWPVRRVWYRYAAQPLEAEPSLGRTDEDFHRSGRKAEAQTPRAPFVTLLFVSSFGLGTWEFGGTRSAKQSNQRRVARKEFSS